MNPRRRAKRRGLYAVLCAGMAFVIIASTLPQTHAHPFTEDTIPARFSNAPPGTAEIIVYYSEAIEIEFSKLEVRDGNGERIDRGDTAYYEGTNSLIVTVPPLQDGLYTVTSRVLSAVDGHLVSDAFVFGVGDVVITEGVQEFETELIFLPEAGARFPGLVGQTIILGSVIASLLFWGFHLGSAERSRLQYHSKFMTLVGAGLVIVFVSNMLMLAVHVWRLEASALTSLQTAWGTTWIIRMSLTVALLGAWFALERAKHLSIRNQMAMLILGLALIGTTTMMGHGAASEQFSAMALDYTHNLVSSIWIGGIIFLTFVILPVLGRMDEDRRERWSLATIPRFTCVAVVALGIVIISGPLLMYLLESDLGTITASIYGKMIMLKIMIASAMVAIGAYHQILQRKAVKLGTRIHYRFKSMLKVEAGLGVALLLVVALLTNGTLPAGEVQLARAQGPLPDTSQQIYHMNGDRRGLTLTEFTESTKFDILIEPFATGVNRIAVDVTDFDGAPLSDLESLKVKVSNPGSGISPIVIPTDAVPGDIPSYHGEITFGFSGGWQVEIEAQRSLGGNEGVLLDLPIKPKLDNLKLEIVEYEFPEAGAPFYPLYDGAGSIWITDTSKPRIWQYVIEESEFIKHDFAGVASIILDIDSKGRIWFTDTPAGQVGFLDPKTGQHETIDLPTLVPRNSDNLPIFIEVAPDDTVWITVVNKNTILHYDPESGQFETFVMPSAESFPFSVVIGPDERAWFIEQATGNLGYIDPKSGHIQEIIPDIPLRTPETITFDRHGNLWISEHQDNGGLVRFNPVLEEFRRVAAPSTDAFPNDAVLDRYGNIWFALHTIDKMAVYDPDRRDILEIPIPTEESWIQFTTADDRGNVWFVEQKPYKLGMVKMTELPQSPTPETAPEISFPLGYALLAGPLMAAGVIATSLFFVRGVRDARALKDRARDHTP